MSGVYLPDEARALQAAVREREMEATGALLRIAIDRHPAIRPLGDGRRVMVGYDENGVWLSAAAVTVAAIAEARWWDPRLATREDRAIQMASQLVRANSLQSQP